MNNDKLCFGFFNPFNVFAGFRINTDNIARVYKKRDLNYGAGF